MQNWIKENTSPGNRNPLIVLNTLLFLSIVMFLPNNCLAQKSFHRDSLIQTDYSLYQGIQQILNEMVKGIVAGDYKKPGWNEYNVQDNLPIDGVYINNKQDHPRLISRTQLELAKMRKNQPPYNLWYQKLKTDAENYDVNNEPDQPLYRANNLKILAFLYYLDKEERYLQKIERILENFPVPPNSLLYAVPGQKWGDNLEVAQTINTLNVAIDLVYNELRPQLRESILQKIGSVIGHLTEIIATVPSNNHMVVISISFLQTAMLIEQTDNYLNLSRVELWQLGLRNLARSLGRIAPDGGYAEGTYYAGFVLSYLSPFVVHFDNMTNVNLINHPTLEKLIQWYLVNDKGSGSYTLFDDGLAANYFFLPILSAFSRNSRSIDLFWRSQPPFRKAHHNFVEAMCVYKNKPYSNNDAPDPIQFYPDMGQAVFKDRWLNPDIFGSFLGENERWFADKHEDIDPLSFEISAFGEDLIVDAGYGQWTVDFYRNLWYKSPYAHNGILVDGLGTYHNPIWGDPLGSTFTHAYQTKNNASVTLQTKIQDVKINRKVYFLQNKFFLILDDLNTNKNHNVSTNFNYSGRLQRLNNDNVRITKNDATLDFLHLSTAPGPLLMKRNYGLRTKSVPPEGTGSFQLEHTLNKPELYATFISPSKEEQPFFFLKENPAIGDGTLYHISSTNPNNQDIEIAINSGTELATAEWQTDARFIYNQKNINNEIESLLLENFTYFKSQAFEIFCDQPVSLFLESNNMQWLGYIEASEKNIEYTLTLKRFPILPLRFNHKLVQTKSINQDELIFETVLKGSGSLEMGVGDALVKMPYPIHSSDQFLVWLAARYKEGQNYDSWSDHDKQQLKNHIVSNLLWGAEKGAEHWSSRIFGEQKTITHATNSLGMLQETISDKSFNSLDIAHRYQIGGEISNNNWSIMEDGTFTEKGILLRNMRFKTKHISGAGMDYQFFHFFEEQQSHSIKLQANDNNFVHYQIAQTKMANFQQLEFYLSEPQSFIHPGYAWSPNTQFNEQFINAGINNYRASFWRSQDSEHKQYYESFSNYGDNWSVNVEGMQDSEDKQRYKQALILRLPQQVNISQQIQVKKNDIWKIEQANSRFYWNINKARFSGFFNYYHDDWFQGISSYINTQYGYINSYIDLHEFKFDRTNEARFIFFRQAQNGFGLTTRAAYKYREDEDIYNTALQQSVYIPLSYNVHIQPMLQFHIPSEDPLQWIGSTLGYIGKNSIYLQVLAQTYNDENRIDYQLAFQSPKIILYIPIDIWLHIQQASQNLDWVELRLLSGSSRIQPGIYYSYDRFTGIRWEGYLQWHW